MLKSQTKEEDVSGGIIWDNAVEVDTLLKNQVWEKVEEQHSLKLVQVELKDYPYEIFKGYKTQNEVLKI